MKYTHFIDRLNEILLTYKVGQLTNLNTDAFLRAQKEKEVLENVYHNPKYILPKEYVKLKEMLSSIDEHAKNNEISFDEVCSIIKQIQMKQLTNSSIRLFHEAITLYDSSRRSLKLKEDLHHKTWYQVLDVLYSTVTGTNPYHSVWKSWYTKEDVLNYGYIQIYKGQFSLEINYHEADVLEILTEGYGYLRSKHIDML